MTDVGRERDRMLDKIRELVLERDALQLELLEYRTIVPATTVDPANV